MLGMILLVDDDQRRTNNEIVNCMRILTRVIPFIYEAQHLRDWHDSFFWEPRRPWSAEPKREIREDMHIGKPLGQETLEIVTNYLFFSGIGRLSYGTADPLPAGGKHEKNQQEVITSTGCLLQLGVVLGSKHHSPAGFFTARHHVAPAACAARSHEQPSAPFSTPESPPTTHAFWKQMLDKYTFVGDGFVDFTESRYIGNFLDAWMGQEREPGHQPEKHWHIAVSVGGACKEKWIAVKLLARIQRANDEKVWNRVEAPTVAARTPAEVDEFCRVNQIIIQGRRVPKSVETFDEAGFPNYVMSEVKAQGFP
ncbi:ATP-dependent RNA helicase DBP2 [Fulvia fulva]|uniref:ATP-dependent RNA helicase DBP2 n=1 Tax=Passalora fulva TaxID=5499 RepID=A0A9Q8LEM7_PASFU|nr:ATP-dependent RNA helicase DBP2 [Fulvia fulva]KAK4616666.1 ATP-dependent RNA helicase DBP2 [Fulvia fulva]UJO16000.1 ATP-dependent RNA helicase DBP2 [Fulvia fulva]